MANAPPPWDDGDESEEEQYNAWNHLLKLFTFQGRSPKIHQFLKEEELCKTALTYHFAIDVIYMSMGKVTERGSNPGEIGKGAHDSKQGFLLGRAQLLLKLTETPC